MQSSGSCPFREYAVGERLELTDIANELEIISKLMTRTIAQLNTDIYTSEPLRIVLSR